MTDNIANKIIEVFQQKQCNFERIQSIFDIDNDYKTRCLLEYEILGGDCCVRIKHIDKKALTRYLFKEKFMPEYATYPRYSESEEFISLSK